MSPAWVSNALPAMSSRADHFGSISEKPTRWSASRVGSTKARGHAQIRATEVRVAQTVDEGQPEEQMA